MCIAIAKQAGVAISESVLERCFDANPDGAGFCVEEDGKLLIKKGYFTFKDFMEAFRPYEQLKALIHFRIKTHGPITEDNCHPFQITEDVAFIHNGIISSVPNHEHKSDTRMFKELYLQPLITRYGYDVLQTPQLKSLINSFIGHSKLVLMKQGEEGFLFFNKQLGNESKEGIWFSNYSWQAPKVYDYSTKDWKQRRKEQDESHEQCSYNPTVKVEVNKLTLWNGVFSFGAIVRTTANIQLANQEIIPKGAVGEVHRVYTNKTMDIDFYKEGEINGVHSTALEVVNEFSDEQLLELGWIQ